MRYFLLILIFTLLGCASDSIEDEYEIEMFGESGEKPRGDEAVLYVLMDEDDDEFRIIHPDSKDQLKSIVYSLEKGDLAKLKRPQNYNVDGFNMISPLYFKSSEVVKGFEKGFDGLAIQEKIPMMVYLFESDLPFVFEKGIFTHWVHKSKSGKKGVKNSIYRVDMECELLDGTKIYSTAKSKMLFEFNKSMPGQVTEGLALIIGEMEEGDKVEVVVPSKLSFGEKGMGDGLIPPNSPLKYKLSLVEIII